MNRRRRMGGVSLAWFGLAIAGLAARAPAAEPPQVVRHVVVYREAGRFAGWPANHGIWSWGNEILVGFSRGYDKDRGTFHHIDHDQPEEFLLARSLDAGITWRVEEPHPPGALAGTPGIRHGLMPPGSLQERPTPLRDPIHFDHPDFALTLRMEETNAGQSRFYYSNDRGKTWTGPYALPLFGQKGVMARTDYVVDGPGRCTLFLTASKANGREGRPFCARTTDGGLTWQFLSFIGPEPTGYAIMPSTVRLSATDLVTTIRRQDPPKSWIDAYGSHDDGRSWSFLTRPEPDTGEGNPPSLMRLKGGRLCLIYGSRTTLRHLWAVEQRRREDLERSDHAARRWRQPRLGLRPVGRAAGWQGRGRLLFSRPIAPRALPGGDDLGPGEAVTRNRSTTSSQRPSNEPVPASRCRTTG